MRTMSEPELKILLESFIVNVEGPGKAYLWMERLDELVASLIIDTLRRHGYDVATSCGCEPDIIVDKGDGFKIFYNTFCVGRVGEFHIRVKTKNSHNSAHSWFKISDIYLVRDGE